MNMSKKLILGQAVVSLVVLVLVVVVERQVDKETSTPNWELFPWSACAGGTSSTPSASLLALLLPKPQYKDHVSPIRQNEKTSPLHKYFFQVHSTGRRWRADDSRACSE